MGDYGWRMLGRLNREIAESPAHIDNARLPRSVLDYAKKDMKSYALKSIKTIGFRK